jgi:hypothetical protein
MKAGRPIAALWGALAVFLLSLIIVEAATGHPANQSPGESRTQVVIIGALHDFHQKNPHYSLEVLTRLIVESKPQAILIELPETSGGQPTVKAGRLVDEFAKRNEFSASQRAADELGVAIYPFDMDRLDDIRRETRFWERQREAAKAYAAFLRTHTNDPALAELRSIKGYNENLEKAIVAFAEKGSPAIINSEAFDSVLRARKRLQPVFDGVRDRAIKAHPEHGTLLDGSSFVGEEWQHRNECMAKKIIACAARFRPGRIVVIVGAEHRYMLRDLLEAESALTCKEYWELE